MRVLLTPTLSPRAIDKKNRCQCEGMLQAEGRIRAAFLVDDVSGVRIDTLNVPMTEERYEWKCAVLLK
jgi:hypothetical protein